MSDNYEVVAALWLIVALLMDEAGHDIGAIVFGLLAMLNMVLSLMSSDSSDKFRRRRG